MNRSYASLAGRTWDFNVNPDGTIPHEVAHLVLLQDIRAELKRLNELLHCSNFTSIPNKLERIRINTAKPRKKKEAV